MQNIASRNASDLDHAARAVLEGLLGRALDREEQVTVMAFPAHIAPTAQERETAVRRLTEHLDRMAAKADGVPEGELEALVDEAIERVRRPRP